MKDKLIETIREVPIAGKTYEEYVEAVAEHITQKEEESTQGIPQVQYERDINANSSVSSIAQDSESVKVVEVRLGEWKDENNRPNSSQFICSVCGRLAYYVQPHRAKNWRRCCPYKFCPNCGAKMGRSENGTN